ncbi:MAG: phosphatidylserine/phosphatidylglycerophosphate/cardiolipin synthase family protein [Desulfatibacillum sp.]|nr:phosphatidylserine/phosphatidylglycerophosphate/cardiolipin synthase family protein [Desulfatibacillum sp.]
MGGKINKSGLFSIKSLLLILWVGCAVALPALAEPLPQVMPVETISETPVVVKDISAYPQVIPNSGNNRVRLSCTVFSPNDNCSIDYVRASMGHTLTFQDVDFRPDPRRTLLSGEGRYNGILLVGDLADPGTYQIPIRAVDTLGADGQGIARFTVEFCRPENFPAVGSPALKQLLEQTGKSVFTRGNLVQVLDDGPAALEKRLEIMEQATSQINLQSYTFDKDVAQGRVMKLLLEKAKQGVEVNIILNAGSQLPTSPAGALRLELDQLVGKWMETAEKKLSGNKPGQFMVKNFLSKSPGRGVNVILVSSRDLAERHNARKGPPAHWLTRVLEDRGVLSPDQPHPEDIGEIFQGPGGLPAFPLLDHAVHEKVLVVDGTKAIVGGRNLEDRYFDTWTDLDLYLEGPLVDQIQEGFLNNYADLSRTNPEARQPLALHPRNEQAGSYEAMFVQSKPWEKDYASLYALIQSIQASTQSLYITSQFLSLPASHLHDALINAAKRGVDVRILTNSYETSSQLYFSAGYFISLNNMDKLLDAGIRIFETNGEPSKDDNPYCHAKEYLYDSQLAAIGSFNLSLRSCYIESENLIFISDAGLCKDREQAFLKEISLHATEINRDGLEDRKVRYKNRMEIAWYLDLLF